MGIKITHLHSHSKFFHLNIPAFKYSEFEHLYAEETYKKNNYIYKEGDPINGIFQVVEGRVKLWKRSIGINRNITLYIINPFDFFAIVENSINQETYRCNATAIDKKVTVRHLPFNDFKQLYLNSWENKFALHQALLINQKLVWKKYIEFQSDDISQRVFKRLQSLANKIGQQVNDEILIEGISHKELADYIGLSRQSVTAAMNKLRQAGRIKYSRKAIFIK